MHELVDNGVPTGKRHDFGNETPPDFSQHPTKSGLVWMPVVRDDDVLGPGQVHNGERVDVENGEVVYRRTARDRTLIEIKDADLAELRETTGAAIVLLTRIIQYLMAQTTWKKPVPADFSAQVLASYQAAKVIADRLDPPA